MNIKKHLPTHSPTLQISVSEHSSCWPHLQFPITQVSTVFPEHFSVDPQKQTFDTQESESPVQSESLRHSDSRIIQFWRANKPRVDLNNRFTSLILYSKNENTCST